MRAAILVSLLAALGAGAGMTAAATASEPSGATMDRGMARPGGVYANVAAPDAIACAQACADDALCMSWTFMSVAGGGSCELKAVIPHPSPDVRATSGLSARAPGFARLVGVRAPFGPPLDLGGEPLDTAPQYAEPSPPPAPARPSQAAASDTVAAASEPPPLPRTSASDAPILLSADTAPLPLRDRGSSAGP
jgi:hypothetical protein